MALHAARGRLASARLARRRRATQNRGGGQDPTLPINALAHMREALTELQLSRVTQCLWSRTHGAVEAGHTGSGGDGVV